MASKRMIYVLFCILLFCSNILNSQEYGSMWENGRLSISESGHYLQFENGEPFFYLGDTGWLLCSKLTREEVERYLENRRRKGFTVIQMSLLHKFPPVNVYGDTACRNNDPSKSIVTEGNNPDDPFQYDYWDHIDYIVATAQEKGIFVGMVPVWGNNVKNKIVDKTKAELYARWLAERYRDKPNIIWINGGDIQGNFHPEVWNAIGTTLRQYDSTHLITFHPYGRTQSSTWFHHSPWLDFNMFQSGHRRYDQDPKGFGEDNWKYVDIDFKKEPSKPTLDGEPSYENIPQGLHDTTQPRWTASDVRRYAYWSVLAGACGFTYGNNAVMQFYSASDSGKGAYGVREYWFDALDAEGAVQMSYLKKLICDNKFFERKHDQSCLVSRNGSRYQYVIVSRGKDFLLVYTYTGNPFSIRLGNIQGDRLVASWFNPRIGVYLYIGTYKNEGVHSFTPPDEFIPGNDWVLVLKAE